MAMTMATASPGGSYAVYGPAWGGIVAQAARMPISYRATSGPNENVILVDRGTTELSMTTMGVAYEALTGSGGWTRGATLSGFRVLFPMYETPFHGLAREPIASLADLAGARVGIGPDGGTASLYLPAILRMLGVADVDLRHGSMQDIAAALGSGALDACFVAAGTPMPAFAEACAQLPLRVFGFDAQEASRIAAAMPELTPTVIARGTYRTLHDDLPTLGMFNFAICRTGLPDELARQIVHAVLQQQPRLLDATPLGAQTVAGNMQRNTLLPLHPGAAAYYRQLGLRLPAATLAG
jgi:TRAP transporter TAXI family solute receptor